MDFPWLQRPAPSTSTDAHARRCQVACEELASRAGLMYRLGFSQDEAAKRLCERIAWEFEPAAKTGGHHRRPEALSDEAVKKIVADTYARRPGW